MNLPALARPNPLESTRREVPAPRRVSRYVESIASRTPLHDVSALQPAIWPTRKHFRASSGTGNSTGGYGSICALWLMRRGLPGATMRADEGTGTMCSRSRRHGQAQSPTKASGTREAGVLAQSAPPILLGAAAERGTGLLFGGLLPGSASGSSGARAAHTQPTPRTSRPQVLSARPTTLDNGRSIASIRRFVDSKGSKVSPGMDTPLPPGMEE